MCHPAFFTKELLFTLINAHDWQQGTLSAQILNADGMGFYDGLGDFKDGKMGVVVNEVSFDFLADFQTDDTVK